MFYNSRQDDQRSRQQKPKSQPFKLKFLLGQTFLQIKLPAPKF